MSKQDLTSKLDMLNAIKDQDVKSPNSIPVDVYLQEAENLFHRATEDSNVLTAVGLNAGLIDDLPVRAGALREAESGWITTRYAHEEAEREWLEKSPGAYDLRNDLLQTFRFAFRKNTDLLGRVSSITEGNGHADMIQDLNDLSVLGKAHADLLAEINFDMSILDEAAQTADEMANLLGMSTNEQDTSDAIKLRNRAFTHLKEAVDEINATGQYVFRNDENKISGYSSAYRRRVRRRSSRNQSEETVSSPSV